MGDRVSVAFSDSDKQSSEESVALFSHWGGMGFAKDALRYAEQLHAQVKKVPSLAPQPIGRFEPSTVMVDFIREITSDKNYLSHGVVASDLYLGKNGDDGDNSDNGHFIVVIDEAGARWHPTTTPDEDEEDEDDDDDEED